MTHEARPAVARQWDAIVVGGGLGGLSSAAHLAACGRKVLLLERHSVLGGSSHVFRRKNRWEFDVGVHYIGDCGPDGQLPTMFRGLGLDDRIHWLPLDPDGLDTIVGPEFELRVPHGWDQYLENLLVAFPGEEKGVRRFVSTVRRLGESIDRSTTPADLRGQVKFARDAGRYSPWAMMPVAALIAACGLSPKATAVLTVQLGAVATSANAAPVALLAGFLQDFVGGGGWFPKGGGQVLAAAFLEVIRAHGGAVRTSAEVGRIEIEGGAVKGVRLATGEVLRSDVVVAAGDIKRTYRDLVGYERLSRRTVRRIERWKMSQPLINGYFGIEVDLAPTPNTNYYVFPSWSESSADLRRASRDLYTHASGRDPLEWAKDFADRQPTYVQSSTRRDPENPHSAPAGSAVIEAQTLAPYDPRLWRFDGHDVAGGGYRKSAAYRAIKEIITEGLLSRIEAVYPGASAKVQWSELATPATQERYTHTTGGNSYGLEPRVSQFGPFRPGSRTSIRGLFLAGTSTSWGVGTEGAMLSGLHAASAVLGRDLQTEVRNGVLLGDPRRIAAWEPDFDPLQACRRLSGGRLEPIGADDEGPYGHGEPTGTDRPATV